VSESHDHGAGLVAKGYGDPGGEARIDPGLQKC
jgi:hypothetical protein